MVISSQANAGPRCLLTQPHLLYLSSACRRHRVRCRLTVPFFPHTIAVPLDSAWCWEWMVVAVSMARCSRTRLPYRRFPRSSQSQSPFIRSFSARPPSPSLSAPAHRRSPTNTLHLQHARVGDRDVHGGGRWCVCALLAQRRQAAFLAWRLLCSPHAPRAYKKSGDCSCVHTHMGGAEWSLGRARDGCGNEVGRH